MRTIPRLIAAAMLLTAVGNGFAAMLYVDWNSPSPTPPYTNWASAARVIQDAVDSAAAGDEVVVTNGVYAAGGRAVGTNILANRVAVDKPLTLRSVNGPEFTVIQGLQVPGITNGDGAIRCVYLASGAGLSGFTLTNGATHNAGDSYYAESGGGVWCADTNVVVSNCVATGNAAYSVGGGSYQGTLNNCTLSGNSADGGGGAFGGTLNNCTLRGNSAYFGGGIENGTLNNCTLTGNSAGGFGGGAEFSSLNNCTLTGNSAEYGGGARLCTLNNCMLRANSAGDGGGAALCSLNNCELSGNTASDGGGGIAAGSANNCTLTGNSAGGFGGGASAIYNPEPIVPHLKNCIVYFNSVLTPGAGANYGPYCDLDYSCSTPLPPGMGNISADPQLASASHLSSGSPCRGAGSADYATGTDIDGEAWATPPSIGCDEYNPGAVSGPLNVSIAATFTNIATGYPVTLTALVEGRTSASVWDFGDGLAATNQLYATHTWTVPGDYAVVLRGYNESQPAGISATAIVHVVAQPVHYVAAGNTNPVAPYQSWSTAAASIQDAVDAAAAAGALVLVTNGIYAAGGRAVVGSITNRVTVGKPLMLRSVNGPRFTVIQGFQVTGTIHGSNAVRCVYLANGASLSGFTLTNGATGSPDSYLSGESDGGGLWCDSGAALISNCVVVGNSAFDSGGGVFRGTLYNCTLIGNSASYGGGAQGSTLNNCTLTGNSAVGSGSPGGGVGQGTLNNCIVYFNTAAIGANYDYGTLNYCCTTPDPGGLGNITNAPLFADQAGGNLRLQSNSPCINSGNNAYAVAGPDLDGNRRIAGGTVDIGAYEFQTPASVISYAWLQQHGLATDGSADYADPDHDGMNNWQEWIAGTNPTNPSSFLKMLAPAVLTNALGVKVRWQSVSGVTYFLELSTNLSNQPAFSLLQSNLVGQPGTTTYTDTNAIGTGPFFYRIGLGK